MVVRGGGASRQGPTHRALGTRGSEDMESRGLHACTSLSCPSQVLHGESSCACVSGGAGECYFLIKITSLVFLGHETTQTVYIS